MAKRTRRIVHDENTRAKIQTTQLINQLMKHINGEKELSASQVNAIKILLGKSLPDLQQIEANVESTQRVVSSEPMRPEDWESQYAGDAPTQH